MQRVLLSSLRVTIRAAQDIMLACTIGYEN